MAMGKEIGEMSLKSTGMTLMPGPGNCTLVQVNFEGPSPQYGVVTRTATFATAGAKKGTFSACGAAYLANGDCLTGTGQGSFESIGIHKWKTTEVFTFSDGSTVIFEAVLDFAERSCIGKVFERG